MRLVFMTLILSTVADAIETCAAPQNAPPFSVSCSTTSNAHNGVCSHYKSFIQQCESDNYDASGYDPTKVCCGLDCVAFDSSKNTTCAELQSDGVSFVYAVAEDAACGTSAPVTAQSWYVRSCTEEDLQNIMKNVTSVHLVSIPSSSKKHTWMYVFAGTLGFSVVLILVNKFI